MVTRNFHDFPDILREWAQFGRRHRGCIVSFLPTNDYAGMERALVRVFALLPMQEQWADQIVYL